MKAERLLVVGNPESVHTRNLRELVGGYFSMTRLTENIDCGCGNFFKALIRTKRLLKEYEPDFIILYQLNLTAFIATLAKNRNIPTLAVGIGSDILLMPKRGLVYRWMLRYILKRSHYYNAGSPYLAEMMRKYCPPDSEIVVANLGINPVKPAEKKNIIYSNRLHGSLYRIDEIIRAFSKFVSKPGNDDWTLVVAGCGREKELSELCESLNISDKVRITSWLSPEENNEYYAVSRVYVSIPESDSFPISLWEAMSAGCLPVVSDLPAYRGIIKDNENAVVVKDSELKGDFFERIRQVDSEKMIRANKLLVAEFADKETNRRKFCSIFDKALR